MTFAVLLGATACSHVDEIPVAAAEESSALLDYEEPDPLAPFSFEMWYDGGNFIDASSYTGYEFTYQGTPTYDRSEDRYYLNTTEPNTGVIVLEKERFNTSDTDLLRLSWTTEFEIWTTREKASSSSGIVATDNYDKNITYFYIDWDEESQVGKIWCDVYAGNGWDAEYYEATVRGPGVSNPFERVLRCTLKYNPQEGSSLVVDGFGTLKLGTVLNPFHYEIYTYQTNRIYSLNIQSH